MILLFLSLFLQTLCAQAFINNSNSNSNNNACPQTCGNATVNATVPYPFGFSPTCAIPLNCSSDFQIQIHNFQIQTHNFLPKTIKLTLQPNCSRPLNSLSHLYTNHYAPSFTNAILLHRCSKPLKSCSIPAINVESSYLRSANCTNSIIPAINVESSYTTEVSCFNQLPPLTDRFLNYSMAVETTGCGYLLSSILATSNNDSSASSSGSNGSVSLEVQVMELEWWIRGEQCRCAADADCEKVVTYDRKPGFRCLCRGEFVGDGYLAGRGCQKASTLCATGKCGGGTNIGVLVGGITSTIGVLILVYIVATYFKRRVLSSVVGMIIWRKNSKCNKKIEAFMSNHSVHTPQRYSYSEVKRMTNSFTTKLGQGGFGSVYKGKLLDGHLVAVKMLDKSKADGQEFINEVASISRTNHINVVTMLGFCYDGRYRALIYEYMPNGSLDKLIFHRGIDGNKRSTHQLEWKVLFEIAVGIAKGLEYLHGGCNIRIVHFDIKPHNILLDEDFCPKISDFGLAKLRNRNESIVSLTGAKGTIGYIAPEIVFRSYGGVSSKSDVYSYGIMILEMVGGRTREIDDEGCSNSSEIYFPDQFYKYFKLEDFSTIYGVLTNDEENVARKMILVGLWCIQTNPSSRPSMVKVVDMLEGSLESLQIPPKPDLYPPTILIQENSTMASSTRYTESQMDEQMTSIM